MHLPKHSIHTKSQHPANKEDGHKRDKTADEGCKGTMNILNTDNLKNEDQFFGNLPGQDVEAFGSLLES